MASELHSALPRQSPGFGTTDYPGHPAGHVPKAYAMVLLAELERLGSGWRAQQPNLARTAGRWLLEHADTNRDGVVGWGLPVAWDAYEDGSVNPPHTEYTITTAIVIDALATWAERDDEAPAARIREVVDAAIAPYLEVRRLSPSGMAPYSLAEADRRYDTFNPAAYLAGQIQRASLHVTDRVRRARYADAADATMRALLHHRRTAPGSGSWYWSYSVQQPQLPNDLPHAGYVIAGIRAYLEHGGRLAAQFDWHAVLAHLHEFRGAAGELRAFPAFFAGSKLPARSYDLGFALHLACTETATATLVPWLRDAVAGYRTAQGRYLKYPRGAAQVAELVVNEYEAYLYRGLAACAMHDTGPAAEAARSALTKLLRTDAAVAAVAARLATTPAAVSNASTASIASAAPAAAGIAATAPSAPPVPAHRAAHPTVPLLPAEAGIVAFDATKRAAISLADGAELALPEPGVPVRTLGDPASTYVFLRRHPDDSLSLLRYEQGRLTCALPLRHAGGRADAMPMLRAATLHGERLHLVYYDNPGQTNWHLAWRLRETGCPAPAGPATPLPSLEEPAGSTYEMVPALHFHVLPQGEGSRLMLAGGNMQLEVHAAGLGPAQRLRGCRHIVESAVTPAGLAHLCVAALPEAGSATRQLVVIAPPGVAPPRLDPALGVPWNLAWSMGALRMDHAAHPGQLRRLLRHDLGRTAPGGWLEFGINNEEGRVPWSQIYVLEGLLDIVELAGADRHLLALYGPLLPEVRRRLDLEIAWLDEHIAAGRHRTRAFTVDRSRALFAVQTSRLLMTLARYRRLASAASPAAGPVTSFDALRAAVQRLEGHIDVLATKGEEARWIAPGRHHLRWPRGSAFAFDGMPVPYNHQNEWAHGVLATAEAKTPPAVVNAATDVIEHFIERIAPEGRLPQTGRWDYWWGRAFDGWDESSGLSVNTPSYPGDHIPAWISFRTIDALALLTGSARMDAARARNARASVADLTERGLLYPFANRGLMEHGAHRANAAQGAGGAHGARSLHLGRPAALEHARVSAPWELGNAAWSLARIALDSRPAP